eukprot:COSAG02_NODE_1469_length_12459_cov_25.847896_2_plen_3164_part_00
MRKEALVAQGYPQYIAEMAVGAVGFGLGVSTLLASGGLIFIGQGEVVSGFLLLYVGLLFAVIIGWSLMAAECVSQGDPCSFSVYQPAVAAVGLVAVATITAALGVSCGFGALAEPDCAEASVVVVTLAVFLCVGAFVCMTAYLQSSQQMRENWQRPCAFLLIAVAVTLFVEIFVVGESGQVGEAIIAGLCAVAGLVILCTSIEVTIPICGKGLDGFAVNVNAWGLGLGAKLLALRGAPLYRRVMFSLGSASTIAGIVLAAVGDSGSCLKPAPVPPTHSPGNINLTEAATNVMDDVADPDVNTVDSDPCTPTGVTITCVGIGLLMGGYWFSYLALRWDEIKDRGAAEQTTALQFMLRWSSFVGLGLIVTGTIFLPIGVSCLQASIKIEAGQCRTSTGPILSTSGVACLASGVGFLFVTRFQRDMQSFMLRMGELRATSRWKAWIFIFVIGTSTTVLGVVLVLGITNQAFGTMVTTGGVMVASTGFLGFCYEYFDAARLDATGLRAKLTKSPTLIGLTIFSTSTLFLFVGIVCVKNDECAENGMYSSIALIGSSITTAMAGLLLALSVFARKFLKTLLQLASQGKSKPLEMLFFRTCVATVLAGVVLAVAGVSWSAVPCEVPEFSELHQLHAATNDVNTSTVNTSTSPVPTTTEGDQIDDGISCGDSGKLMTAFAISAMFLGTGPGLMILYWNKIQAMNAAQIRKQPPMLFGVFLVIVGVGLLVPGIIGNFITMILPGTTGLGVGLLLLVANTAGAIEKLQELQQAGWVRDGFGYGVGMCVLGIVLMFLSIKVGSTKATSASMMFAGAVVLAIGLVTAGMELLPVKQKSRNKSAMLTAKKKTSFFAGGVLFLGGAVGAVVGISATSALVVNASMFGLLAGIYLLLCSFFWQQLAGSEDADANRFIQRAKLPPVPVGATMFVVGIAMVITGSVVTGSKYRADITFGSGWMVMGWGAALALTVAARLEIDVAVTKLRESKRDWRFQLGAVLMLAGAVQVLFGAFAPAAAQSDDESLIETAGSWQDVEDQKTAVPGSLLLILGVMQALLGSVIACFVYDKSEITKEDRATMPHDNLNLATIRYSIVLFLVGTVLFITALVILNDNYFWSGIQCYIASAVLVIGSMFHERYTRAMRTVRKEGAHPVFVIGALLLVGGIVVLAFGWACMEGNEIGAGDCWLAGHRLVPWGVWLIGLGYYMVFMKLEWRVLSDWKPDYPDKAWENLKRLHPTYTALTFIVSAIVIGSVAAALMDDNLVGVDCSPGTPCYGPPGGPRNTGWLLMKMAFALMGNGVLILGTMILRMKLGEDFNVGEALRSLQGFLERWFCRFDAVCILGNSLTVLALMAFLFGLICISGDTCETVGVWFTMVSVDVFCLGILLRLWKYAIEYADTDEGGERKVLKVFQDGFVCFGIGIVVTGVITLSGGIACLDGSIGGTTECRPAGIFFTTFGSCVILLGLLVTAGASYYSKLADADKLRSSMAIRKAMGPLWHLFTTEDGPTKGRMLALFIDIAGIVVFSFGAACLNDTLVGKDDCRAAGFVLVIVGPSVLLCGLLSACMINHDKLMSSASSGLKNVAKKPLWVAGEVFFVIGVVLTSVGWACAKNNLGKIEDCDRRKANITLVFGVPTFATGLVCMVLSFMYWNTVTPADRPSWDKAFMFLKAIVGPKVGKKTPLTVVGLMLLVPGIALLISGGFCVTTPTRIDEDAGVVLPNCQKAGKVMIIVGAVLGPLGLLINVVTAWWKVYADEKTQNNTRLYGRRLKRTFGAGDNTKAGNAISSLGLIVVGSVLLAVGWAGLVGTLAGQRTGLDRGYILPHNGVLLVLMGGSLMLFSFGMIYAQFRSTGVDYKADQALLATFWPRLWKNSSWFWGTFLLVLCTTMCSLSFACFDDNVVGVKATVKVWPRITQQTFGSRSVVTVNGTVLNPTFYDNLAENCRSHQFCLVVGEGPNATCVNDHTVPRKYISEAEKEVWDKKECEQIAAGKWMHPTERNECPLSFAIVLMSTFAPLWFLGLILMALGWFSSLGTADKDRWRQFARRTIKKPSFIVGLFCLASGIVLGSVGAACANNTLVGVEDCVETGWVLLYIGIATTLIGLVGTTVTERTFRPYEDYDDEKKQDTDKQMLMFCVTQLAVPFFTWGVACTSGGPPLYYTCGPTGIWGGLFLMMMPSWTIGLGMGMYVKWNSICGGCVRGLDTIIADPRTAPVVVLRAVKAKEKEWKNYRAQNPNVAERVDNANDCCNNCCQSFTNFVLGCVDNRYFCARWILANYIPPPEEDDANEAGLAPDDISVSGFDDDSDEEAGSFAALLKGRKMKLVPGWDKTPPRRQCCWTVAVRQQPAEERAFWMTERPLELRWAVRRGTFFTRARVMGCREDVTRWADEIEHMRGLIDEIETKPFGPERPADDEDLTTLQKLKLDAATPTQADINEEERMRRQLLDVIAEKIDLLEQYQARSFTIHTEQKGDVQIMVPLETSDGRRLTQTDAESVRDMWVEKLQDMIAEAEAADELQNAEGDGVVDDDDSDDGDDDSSGGLDVSLANWLQENNLSSTADVLQDFIKPLTIEEVKRLTRKSMTDLGMDDELNEKEMEAFENALEWEPVKKHKKPSDYPKSKVVLKVQVRGGAGAAGSGLLYSFKEQRVEHPKLEPNDNDEIALLETIAAHINRDESMGDNYLPLTATKIQLAPDYCLDDGSSGEPLASNTPTGADAPAQQAAEPSTSAAAAVALAEAAHQAIVDQYTAAQAAEENDVEEDVGADTDHLARLDDLMQRQEAARQRLDRAAAWHSAETELAALVAERAEAQALLDTQPAGTVNDDLQQRLEKAVSAEKEAAEQLRDAKAVHEEEYGAEAEAEDAQGYMRPLGKEDAISASEEYAPAAGDSWTLTLVLPGDVIEWQRVNGLGEKPCRSVELGVAESLDLAGDHYEIEVLSVMEFTSRQKKQMDKSRRKTTEQREAARKQFFKDKGPQSDEGKTSAVEGKSRWRRRSKKEQTEEKDDVDQDNQPEELVKKRPSFRSLFNRNKGAEPEAEAEADGDPKPQPEPEITDESLVPPVDEGLVPPADQALADEAPADGLVPPADEAPAEDQLESTDPKTARKERARKEKERKKEEKERKKEEKKKAKADKKSEQRREREAKKKAKEDKNAAAAADAMPMTEAEPDQPEADVQAEPQAEA